MVDLENNERTWFKVNGQKIKINMGKLENVRVVKDNYLDEVNVIKRPESFHNVKSSTAWEAGFSCFLYPFI